MYQRIRHLREDRDLTQARVAKMLDMSQTGYSKYETGESLPDIEKCKAIADVFDVSMDDLVNYEQTDYGLGVPPRGKHMFGMVKVGDKGQIVIPAKARKLFQINPGDNLIVLGDEMQGIAMLKEENFLAMVNAFREG